MAYTLYAEFPQSVTCRKRQYSGLLRWSAYIKAGAFPTDKPTETWVEQWLVAERIPINAEVHVQQTMSYMVASPDIQTNMRQHLNPYNDETTEASMDAQVDTAISTSMPAYCHTQVSQQQIDQWYADNGFTKKV